MATFDGDGSPSLTALPGVLGETKAALIAGRYELMGLIGVGGMGSVYRALDRLLDERVALKMLRPELVADPAMLDRFRAEVRLARRVTHRNVARTFDIGEHEGARFLTMELVDGESLATLVAREGPLTILRTVEIAGGICEGLAAAHAASVVHRDLKPDNVLIGHDGRIVLTDFGIARAYLESGAVRTQGIVGTPAYMAPEQVEGRDGIDGRADIYALGAVLFEMLTGQCPWRGETALAVAVARLVSPPPNPRSLRADLPDALVRVIGGCLATRPDDRPASVEEVAAALGEMTLPAPAGSSPSAPVSVHTSVPPASVRHAVERTGDAKTVAVLPFRNTGTADDEYLAEGLSDDLIDTLSMTPGLKVRPRSAVAGRGVSSSDPRDVGRELGVQVVVDGSLRRISPDGLRINARVVSVADGFQLWARRFDCAAAEILAVGDQAATAIAEVLTVEAPRAGPLDSMTDPVAVDLFLRARHAMRHGWAGARTNDAPALFAQAYARAPNDPVIVSAYAHILMRESISEDRVDQIARAKVLAEKALTMAPDSVEVRFSLASIALASGNAIDAARHLTHVLGAAHGSAQVQGLTGLIMSEVGLAEEGLSRLLAAAALDSTLKSARWDAARISELRGEPEEANRILAEGPGDTDQGPIVGYWLLRARLLLWRDDAHAAEEATRELREARFPLRDVVLGMAAMVSSRSIPSELERSLRRQQTGPRSPRRAAFTSQLGAEIWSFGGDPDQAFGALEQGITAGLLDRVWLELCPALAGLRTDPRYASCHARIEARAAPVRAVFDGG